MISRQNHDDAIGFGELIGPQNNPVSPVTLRYIVTGPTGFFSCYVTQLLLQPSHLEGTG